MSAFDFVALLVGDELGRARETVCLWLLAKVQPLAQDLTVYELFVNQLLQVHLRLFELWIIPLPMPFPSLLSRTLFDPHHFDHEKASTLDRNHEFFSWWMLILNINAEPGVLIRLDCHFEEGKELVVDSIPFNEVHFIGCTWLFVPLSYCIFVLVLYSLHGAIVVIRVPEWFDGVVPVRLINPGWTCDFGGHFTKGVMIYGLPEGVWFVNWASGFDLLEDFEHDRLYFWVFSEEKVAILGILDKAEKLDE